MAEQNPTPTPSGRHQASGNQRLGLLFSLSTVICWSTLPVALKITLTQLDPWTLTWFRFVIALGIGGLVVLVSGRLAEFRRLTRTGWWLLAIAAVCLTINYVAYLLGLDLTTPANSQVIIQLAPVLMALGGIALFGERYTLAQLAGFLTLIAGLSLFFSDQLGALWANPGEYLAGTGFVLLAAVVWALYAMAQKQLLRDIGGQSVMAVIYLFATFAMLPLSKPAALAGLTTSGWIALWFCAINTIGAYSSFTAALNHWDASRVSAAIALVPLGTVAVGSLATRIWPQWIAPESIGTLGWIGAAMVVSGSMATALLGRKATDIVPIVEVPKLTEAREVEDARRS